ncbi:helix-turn-helix domain-containing protein [Mucilaginibacter koreensis]
MPLSQAPFSIPAPDQLIHAIKNIWYTTIDFAKVPSLGFEVLPDGYAEIIFYMDGTCSMETDDGIKPLSSPFLTGLLNQPLILHTKGQLQVIGIKCYPWAVFDLLSLPADKDGVRVFEHPIATLQPVLEAHIQAKRINEALIEVKKYLIDADAKKINNAVVNKAGTAMRKANGMLPVKKIAAEADATIRTLERKFKQASGYSVKDVAGLMRFEQVRNRLWLQPESSLAQLAPELGYTDQAHLSREFKRYSGSTPAAFARKAKKEQLVMNDVFVAFVQA